MLGLTIMPLGPGLYGAETRIEICHDRAKTTIWLQLTNTQYIVNGSTSPRFVTVLIGAIQRGSGWVPIDAGTAARCRDVTIAVHTMKPEATTRFQIAIVNHWRTFDSAQARNWAKGTTLRASLTNASFVMKALKTGFDAIGEPMAAYSGFRTADFTLDEVLAYLTTRSKAASTTLSDGALLDFRELMPAPAYAPPYAQDRTDTSDKRTIPCIASARAGTHGGRFAYTAVTSDVPYERVITYGFRGDSRPPSGIKNAGGFLPNYTRPAHIEKNWLLAQDQALNLQKFISDQEYGGYLSVTKSTTVAKGFAIGYGGTTPAGPGWIYACFVEGGFHLPARGTHKWVQFDEQEISMPGIIEWEDIVGCRYVLADGRSEGSVYLKDTFLYTDAMAAVEVWELLSGKSQGPGP
ncbi:hypothetical protein OVY01_06910 [Robbsia sp. Bb-Pol-6]|uniref:Pierisin-like domain-containing protein n=1 Tax=Robbsia betulipollinis TaxID=2981849 RepID=A0ABT3ZKA0_9BURK|nr:hypothetical protein [Robbsia betulipollinis]MCY0386966.1 hypothetical protein [Robbsia betulipollinis]